MLVENDLIILRSMTYEDIDDFYDYRSRPEVCRFQGFKPIKREDCQRVIDEMGNPEKVKPGQWIQLGIIEKKTMRLIGDCGYKIDEKQFHIADIGYSINPDFQRKGFATVGLQLLSSYLFKHKNIIKIIANIDPRNFASEKLLEKLAFKLEVIQRCSYLDPYERIWVDEHFYALFKED